MKPYQGEATGCHRRLPPRILAALCHRRYHVFSTDLAIAMRLAAAPRLFATVRAQAKVRKAVTKVRRARA